jgi:maltooligosyltrehalose trehalohydrolase
MHTFTVWAPKRKKVAVKIGEAIYPMEGPGDRGYWTVRVDDAGPGTDYAFLLEDDATPYPDPRSLWQPHGVHGASRLYDHFGFHWDDETWQGPPLSGAVIYELHIGTFTPEGDFDAAISKLRYLYDLGITHVEVMPVAEAAGDRGWGYDGVDLFATNSCYGGPDAFKRFVNACHAQGIGVILDVVYNHFGPVGNYTGKFGPYVTNKHKTPWGDAVNLEDRGSDEVRKYFSDNALMWMREFHVDGLRLDAIHELVDRSAVHFLEQLAANVDNLSATVGRRLILIAESDLNNPCIVRPIEANGYGMDAQWTDDFHHALFTLLHVEDDQSKGYYSDFGEFECLAKSLKDMYVYDGVYSEYRKRHHGRPVDSLSAHHFIGFIQNHDQVGNRATGDRLEHIIGVPRTKIALGIVMTAPFIPMLFQGEEFAASTPFLYFADHEDPEMARLVAEGRKKEFAAFGWDEEQIPNPEEMSTFTNSRLNWAEVKEPKHLDMLEWTTRLIHIRRNSISLNDGDRGHLKVTFSEEEKWLRMDRNLVSVFANLGTEPREFRVGPEYELLLTSIAESIRVEDGLVTVPPDGFAIVSAENAQAAGESVTGM